MPLQQTGINAPFFCGEKGKHDGKEKVQAKRRKQ
jgi:hypothetical protein